MANCRFVPSIKEKCEDCPYAPESEKMKSEYWERKLALIKTSANSGNFHGVGKTKAGFRYFISEAETECRKYGFHSIANIMENIRTGHPFVIG